MQFLVHLTPELPESLTSEELEDLFRMERIRALELIEMGSVTRMWRVAGTRAGASLWEAECLEELHELLSSLPAWRYCKVNITPLIQHPLEAAYEAGERA